MPPAKCTVATLRIMGDDLDPKEISRLLGCEPTSSQMKGDVFKNKRSGKERIARIGMWRLEVEDREPGDEESQIEELLSKVSADLSAWESIMEKYRSDIFFGLFLGDWAEGFGLSASTMMSLASRGIELGLDIYGPDDEIEGGPNQLLDSIGTSSAGPDRVS